MRRFHALLIAAGLAAAPASAAAGPSAPPRSTVESVERPTSDGQLGVLVLDLTPELRTHLGVAADRGVLVARVEPTGHAARAKLAVGDVIVAVRGRAVDGAADISSALAGVKASESFTIDIVRDHKPLALRATPADGRTTVSSWPDLPWWRELRQLFEAAKPDRVTQRS